MAVNDAASLSPPAYIPSPPAGAKNEDYYFDDGNLVIQVEGTLFRVWDGTIRRHAKGFPFSLQDKSPASPGGGDVPPLVLEGVVSADFERLLWILYPPVLGECKAKTAADWTAILSLATRWDSPDIRALAIRELGALPLEPVEKIALQQTYSVERKWAGDAYLALCARGPALDVEEGRKLGIETTIAVARAREKLDKWGRKKPEEVKKVVAETFEIVVE